MSHPAQHEERILRFALADPGQAQAERVGLAARVRGCPECQAFGYRALADLPGLLAAAELPPAAAARWGDRSAERLEAVLAEAAAPAPEPEGVRPTRLAFFLRLGLPRPTPSVALALLLVFLVLLGVPLLRQPTVGPAFARAQLRLVLEALPPGYSFLAAPPSPFWRGYSLGLLGDLEAAGLRLDEAEALRGVLLPSALAPEAARALIGRLRCEDLERGEENRGECRHGVLAYRVRRALAEGGEAGALLASEEAADLLAWAGSGAAPHPETEAAWAALVEVLLRQR